MERAVGALRVVLAFIGGLALCWLLPAGVSSQSRPSVSLTASEGPCVVVVGWGWALGDEVVVRIGRDEYRAIADPGGMFTVPTRFPSVNGAGLSYSWRRADDSTILGSAAPKVITFAPPGQAKTAVETVPETDCSANRPPTEQPSAAVATNAVTERLLMPIGTTAAAMTAVIGGLMLASRTVRRLRRR